MNAKQLMRLVAVLFVLVAVGSFASAATWYVDGTNGDDNFGNGTQLNPYRSITKGIAVAATGDILSIAAGIYDNAAVNHSGDAGTITVSGTKSLTFVSTTVGADNTAILTNGLNMNSTGTLSIGEGTSQFFNLGSTATALTVTKGAVTLATAKVIIGNGGTLTIVDGSLSAPPTITSNLNVSYTGTTAVSSATHFPANIGSGTLTINTTSTVTIAQALTCGSINVVAGNATFSADVTANTSIALAGTGAVTMAGVTSIGAFTNACTGGVTIAGNVTMGKAAVVSSGAPPAEGTTASTPDFVNNAATGTVTVGTSAGNTVTLYVDGDAAGAAVTGSLINAAAGTLTVNSSVIINVKNITPATVVNFAANPVIDNQGAGTMTIAGTIAVNNVNFFTSGTGNNVGFTVAINSAAGGTLSIGALTTPAGAAGSAAVVNVNLVNAGTMTTKAAALLAGTITSTAGTLTLGSAGDAISSSGAISITGGTLNITGNLTSSGAATAVGFAAGTTVNVNNSASTIAGLVTNAGKIVLGSNTLTLSGTGAGVLASTGDIYSTATATIGTGTLKFTGASPAITGGGNMPALQFESATAPDFAGGLVYGVITKNGAGTLTLSGATDAQGDIQFNAGNIALGANLTVRGTFFMNSASGTLAFGANTLDLKGDFNRTGGTIGVTEAGTGTLQFSGSNVQSFIPGVQMTTYNVVVNNTGIGVLNQDVITQNGSLIVLNNYTITAGRVNLGLSNIRMAEVTGAVFTNGGRGYVATGVGGVIFQGTGGTAGGAHMAGTNPYSNVYIRLSTNTNNVICNAAVVVSGILSLEGGGITWNTAAFTSSTLTLSDVLTTPGKPTVVVRTDNRATALMVDGADGGAVALAIVGSGTPGAVYNLTYIGPTDRTATGNEWIITNLNNLSINVDDAKTITGPGGATTITGILTIAGGATGGATLDAAAGTITASGSVAHSVAGTFQNGTLAISGAAASIAGSTGVSPVDDAAISTLSVTGASFTATNLKVITDLTYNNATGSATITMNRATSALGNVLLTAGTMALDANATASTQTGNLTVTAGSMTYTRNGGAAGTRTVAGTVTLTAGTLTLGSKVDVTTALAQANGALALGTNDMTLVGTYTRTGTGAVSGTGKWIAAPTAGNVAYTLNAGAKIPNLELKASAGGNGIQLVTTGLEVTNSFTHTLGDLNLGALNLTLSGSIYNYTAGTYTATTGALVITGTTATLAANPTIPNLTINSVGKTVTLVSTDNTTPTPRTINVSVALVHTDGLINLGINSIALTDVATVGASYTRGTATALFTQGVSGALIFGGAATSTHTLNQGPDDALVIPNLTINRATSLGAAKLLTVAQTLTFAENLGFGVDGRLVLSDGATVDRTGTGVLSNVPAIGATINNIYDFAVTTDKELTTSTTALKNLTINAATTLNAPTTVNGKLTLNAALTTTSPNLITMGGTTSTLVVSGGSISAPVIATVYNLEYSTTGTIATDNNTWPALAQVASLTFSGTGVKQLHANRNVTGLLTLAAGSFDLNGSKLTASGDIKFTNGTITNSGASTELIISGAAAQTITLNGNLNVPAAVNIRVAKTGLAVATIVGGDLNFNTNTRSLFLDSGILSTVSGTTTVVTQAVIIARPTTTALFYTRTAGMVYGKVRYPITSGDGQVGSNGSFDFPVGTLDGQYRPATIAFTPNYVAMTPTNLEVQMINTNPGGVRGLPVVESATLKIGGYPNFYWRVATTPNSMLATQQFDVILQTAANIGYSYDRVVDLRIVRRQDGDAESNTWAIQGSAASYAAGNYIQVLNGDSILFVRSSSSQGGIVSQGTILTIGIPTRKPGFVTVVPLDTVEQIGTITQTITAAPQNIGDQATLSLVNPPTGATLGATTQQQDGNAQATLTYAPTFATAPGLVSIVVRATNTSGLTADTTIKVLVTRSASRPTWTAALATQTITDGQLLNFTYTVSLPAGDTAVFTASVKPSNATFNTTTGAFAWTPYFAQAGSNYTVTVRAANKRDVTLYVDTTATITVNHRYAKGDADGSGQVLPADASRVLRHVAGISLIPATDSARTWAADASGNGQISAYDASLILQYAAGIITVLPPPPGKAPATEGSLAWGKLAQTQSALTLPLKVSGASNIYAVQFTANIGSLELDAVKANLPKDWSLEYRAADGKLVVAAAGVTPIADGDIATISFKNIAYQATTDVVADAMLNESINASIQATVKPVPNKFALENNYPNPFNPTTTIRYALPQDARVNVTIYNIQGQIVRTLVGADQTAGYYTIQWDGRSDAGSTVASGIYIYRINAGSFVSAKKMVMLK